LEIIGASERPWIELSQFFHAPSATESTRGALFAMRRTRSGSPQQTEAGDLIITKVSDHYHLSRSQGSGKPFAPIDVITRLPDAIERACLLATGHHRVFLYANSGSPNCIEIDCAKPP
jgi:hypothetical protein